MATAPPLRSPEMLGAIAADDVHTAEAGAGVLAMGGSAVDALVAAALCGFVAEGPLTGPAGGGFLLVHGPGVPTRVLDCFFAVPSRPLRAAERVVIDFGDASTQAFDVGPETVAVPGLVAGLEEAHRRLGRVPWKELFEPALVLARTGVALSPAQRVVCEGDEAAAALAGAGYRVVPWAGQNLFFGGVSAVERRPEGGFAAAGDPRRGGHGIVVAE